MKIFIHFLAFLILSASPTFAARSVAKKTHPCQKRQNRLCGSILQLSPELDMDFALKISDQFLTVSRKYKIPPLLLVSIAKQESNFRLDVVRKVNGLSLVEGAYKESTVGSDFCMMQINVYNIKRLHFDAGRLITDSGYCIDSGAQILNSFRKGKTHTPPGWWSRYNASSEFHRQIYQKYVLKHWRKIDPQITEDDGV